MNEFLKDSFIVVGNWVILSVFAGLVVGVFLLVYRYFNHSLSAKLQYHTALLSLATLLLFTFTLNFLLPDISETFNERPNTLQTDQTVIDFQIENQLGRNAAKRVIANAKVVKETSFASIVQLALGIFWLTGVLIYSFKFAGGFLYLKFLLKNAAAGVPEHWQAKAYLLKNKLKISRNVALKMSSKVTSPLTFGFIRPVIIFPLGFFSTLPPDQIEAIILHELYHIKHRDYLYNLGVMLMEIIFFYHPLMWYLSKEIHTQRENSCDDAVISQIRNPLIYANALINVEEFRRNQGKLSMHFSPKHSQLNHRVMRLFSKKTSKSSTLKPFLGLLCLTFFLMSFTLLSWDTTSKDKEKETKIAEQVHVKIDKNNKFILLISESSIYATAENQEYSVWLDDEKLSLNNFHAIKYAELEGMVGTGNEKEYRVYSKEYLSQIDDNKLQAESKEDVIYRFHTNGGTHFTTEFNTWENKAQTTTTGAVTGDDQYTINGPARYILDENEQSAKVEELDNEELLRLNSLKPQSAIELIEMRYKKAVNGFVQDDSKLRGKKSAEEHLISDSLLIVLDGEILGLGSSHLKNLSPKMIHSICVLKDEMAVEKYGDIARNGVLELYTKKHFAAQDQPLKSETTNDEKVSTFNKEEGKFLDSVSQNRQEQSLLNHTKGEAIRENDSIAIILNGEVLGFGGSNIPALDHKYIDSFVVLKGKEVQEKYGLSEINKAVEITTSDDFDQQQLNLFIKSFNEKQQGPKNGLTIMEGEQDPLFFVNGVPMQKSYLKKLHPNDIKKIEVLKGDAAIKKYGEKGKNGVIEIYIKEGDSRY